MPDEELTPWEEKERLEVLEEKLREIGLSSKPEWDNGDQSRIVNPTNASYPPPYDPWKSVKPEENDKK